MDIRPSPLAGRWYPKDKDHLRAELTGYLSTLPEVPHEQILGLLAPHAGLIFSGPVGAKGFCHLTNAYYDYVVIIGPSHYPSQYPLLTTGHDAFETPMGKVPVAQTILQKLGEKISLHPVRNDPEHSIEMPLLFLQHLPGDFQLVPLVMRDQSFATSENLAAALHQVLQDQKVLYVASSDLSHFFPEKVANQLDTLTLNTITTYNPEDVTHLQDSGVVHACGYGAIATVMLVTQQQGTKIATKEGYGTSADVTGDYSRVVGYGSVIFHS